MFQSVSTRQRRLLRLGSGLALCALLALVARVVHQAEQSSLRELHERFRMRAGIAAPFLRAYVDDLLKRERAIATRELSGATVDSATFDAVVRAFGFEAAVLVDSSGKLMRVFPARAGLIGTDVAQRYAHLREALARGRAVSSVVPSAAAASPIVGFAVRYDSASGPRVFSGAYDVSLTPLSVYMSNVVPIRGASADLVDSSGILVASNRRRDGNTRLLASADPRLAKAAGSSGHGRYEGDRGAMHFVATAVRGTPWRLIAAVEESALYAPIGGSRRQVYWWLFAAFCSATSIIALLLVRLIESRGDLRSRNSDLARLARIDPLTEVANRLHLKEQLARLQAAARRSGQPLSALIIDVDRFKLVNDCHGHAAGDEVLRALAARMAAALRAGDVFGRWGGEEFLALLPNVPTEGTARAGERLRTAASCMPIGVGSGRALHITVSIGCATTTGAALDTQLLSRADAALYRAKELGRDRVVVSIEQPLAQPTASTAA